ncbi:MAG: ABC transporter ATP-binding protein/permease [Clostridiales Family XIII bacterium]|jgi:ABC-type multidrug transport system fused ATPase/permease subunit|nr:ABC transporter ATP-binding protein/permease [Clostridiales Family XIII bacterium]
MDTLLKIRQIFSRGYKLRLLILLAAILFGAALETLALSLISPFISILLDHSYIGTNSVVSFAYRLLGLKSAAQMLILLSFSLAALYVFKGVYTYLVSKLQYRIIGNGWVDVSERLIRRLLGQPYLYHAASNLARMQKAMGDVAAFFGLIAAMLQFATEIAMIVFIVVFLMVISLKMTLLVILMAALCVAFYFRVFRGRIRKWGQETYEKAVAMNKAVNQAFGGIKELKVLRREAYFINEFVESNRGYVKVWRQYSVNSGMLRLIIESVCFGCTFVFVALFMLYGADLAPMVPKLSIFILAAFRLLPSVSRVSTYVTQIIYNRAVVEALHSNLFEEFKASRPDFGAKDDAGAGGDGGDGAGGDGADAGASADGADTGAACAGPADFGADGADPGRDAEGRPGAWREDGEGHPLDIKVSGISFSYPNADAPTLENLTLTIPHNRAVAFVGSSGAGKTTLADIILGILPPQRGQVSYDGFDVHERADEWAKRIGYIPQQIYLIDETIAENVAFGLPRGEISEAGIWEALEKAQLADFVRALPDGLDTVVGDRGVRLSGGQRQRIGIARALYNETPILVLDEATSSLDNETEAAVMEAIMGLHGNKTLIIVAHRLSTIEHCDIVYRVDGGTVSRVR